MYRDHPVHVIRITGSTSVFQSLQVVLSLADFEHGQATLAERHDVSLSDAANKRRVRAVGPRQHQFLNGRQRARPDGAPPFRGMCR